MRYIITLCLLTFAVSSRAQITLEHSYSSESGVQVDLIPVDSAVWKYVTYGKSFDAVHHDTITIISIFNLDHSLDRVITVPPVPTGSYSTESLITIAKHLFAMDGAYEYLYQYGFQDALNHWHQGLRVFGEDGRTLFSRDTCQLSSNSAVSTYAAPSAIKSTDSGVKMIIFKYSLLGTEAAQYEIYSLPGKLPANTQKAGIVNSSSSSFADAISPGSAYPNPASGRVRIAYDLPRGVASGEMILTSEDGREVKRYHVTNAFSDLLIEATDLPSGSYFYKLVTDKGESPAQRIVWMR